MRKVDARLRFFAKVTLDHDSGCWKWTGAKSGNGYGEFWGDGEFVMAHRYAWGFIVGVIPDGLQIDHLCRVRDCVNPAHMEVVTGRENMLRGESPAAKATRTGRCHSGHLLSGLNVYLSGKSRKCRACRLVQFDAERGGPPTISRRERRVLDAWLRSNP